MRMMIYRIEQAIARMYMRDGKFTVVIVKTGAQPDNEVDNPTYAFMHLGITACEPNNHFMYEFQ